MYVGLDDDDCGGKVNEELCWEGGVAVLVVVVVVVVVMAGFELISILNIL